jgi:ABC-type dipeptide/oligopeptide/nickel transport system permease component
VLLYAIRRAAWAVMLCLIVSLFTFMIFYVVPRGQNTQRTRGTLQDVTRTQQFSGPVPVQYAKWVQPEPAWLAEPVGELLLEVPAWT